MKIRRHNELIVYQRAFSLAMRLFNVSKAFPVEERYSLVSQMRRSSRGVCANLAEAWRKRRYRAAFVSKLSDSEAEAAETQVWIQFAVSSGYFDAQTARVYFVDYDEILAMLVHLIKNADEWVLPS